MTFNKLSIIVVIIIIITLCIHFSTKPKVNTEIPPIATHQIDSLKQVIKAYKIIIDRDNKRLDSLYDNRTKIYYRYETTIKDFSNPTIVSDDSINKYISNKLRNK